MYEVELSTLALKQLKKLEKTISERIIKILERCRIRPQAYAKKLVGVSYFSLRSGDYRIIIDIKEEKLIVFVIELGHRKEIYKN